MITPFDSSGNIDFDALTRIVNHIISGGIDYIVVWELLLKLQP